jgi:hypothetical protein
VQVPVARTDWVEETRITQVPVTTYHTANQESITRVPVSMAPNATATAVASRPVGGQQMQGDPPREQSQWADRGTGDTTYRR